MGHSRHQILLGSASSGTSPDIFIGDCRVLALSIQTSNASSSVVSVNLSNDDGFQSGISFRSTVTVLTTNGIFYIDPGARWMQVERPNWAISAASVTTVTLNRYYA